MTDNEKTAIVRQFLAELGDLMEKHNAYLGVRIEGDVYGITEDFVAGIGDDEAVHVISPYSPWLDAHDIFNYLTKN